ncbi:MAG: UvrD-helicase domain-containing protein, partial [Bacillota bacterium]|nr:UvrD-helicase domain-containing protein [Bacillota bacterium]
MDFTKKLNDKQLAAVSTNEQHVRVIAGAGSGKTRVLTHRIVY